MNEREERVAVDRVVVELSDVIASEMRAMADEAWNPRYAADQSDSELEYRRKRIVGLRQMREHFENLMFGMGWNVDGTLNVNCSAGDDVARRVRELGARIVTVEARVTEALNAGSVALQRADGLEARLGLTESAHDRLDVLEAQVGEYAQEEGGGPSESSGMCADIESCGSKTDRLADRVSALERGPV